MRMIMLTIFLFSGISIETFAGTDEPGDSVINHHYPVPRLTERLLFYVQRTHNMNTIIYELNFQSEGNLDKQEPLHPLWIRYEEGGLRKELSFIQNRVYGLEVSPLENETWLIRFRAYKKREIYLMRSAKSNIYKAMIRINGKMAELTSLFICSVTNALGIPSTVKYIDINGIDPATGEVVFERVIP
ncbi:MAG: DUF4833 domain-containing protein [Bacteroidales bacterium]|nr:DUF4833 domain-containing protein [Bacteroidales bacterium]